MNTAPSRLDSEWGRISLLILVAVLLNIGLFFILAFFAPLVSGIVVGFFIGNMKKGSFAGFIGAFLSYSAILLITEFLTGFATDILTLVSAVLLMGIIGALGGLIGVWIRSRST
ncbi:MAG: hypothetical protein ACXAAO_09390 [Candidatus Thorarchaeota archaeon]